ncbi:2-C-methyl-D-erythritol 4-phosphate cytidylyltransferase [Arcanobacterium haemolyticum]|uniref:2-C-methyl-D-erythritol 4-phosphate cytidylyltransferase n=1 Tax=Arcanobacterium haemolyticum (strain ATCC 9345 / DSM 20595 / CCM 5947 / CCUG 17215 / LMG 16163 / NBRC 15585 / NCTC 8452 / 11018) TaxID=644284 RepID=D7BL17_ARCHD|nr:2-C-methyl-D-erythritol 4-phosphate cytidylyltransferase [Arcanobacterium haemolyticum]ADH93347.1 2-C-methyl-D-erythritol 4-phosphate cytidylyltransferase [Arcanobacterium haemolyticum DSM 20595]QCX47374.1 2-C-methyl-D-erythritol 4-phosphate cytidylyltransferase [Arcanobacterium haemolyticum]SQH27798.1 2-C-methyl-D-erythritol 4-phosphate cytidylyltransferase [Arcanobacterium haemolyticum]
MSWSAIIAGAGSGSRLGSPIPKALVHLHGEALIVHAVRSMKDAGIEQIIVTIPEGYAAQFESELSHANLTAQLVVGGSTRQESVANGLRHVTTDYVLVHDAARSLTPQAMIHRVMETIEAGTPAVIPALPVIDTIKQVDCTEKVVATVQREHLRSVQTPQGFSAALLRTAHTFSEQLSVSEASAITDDASLIELMGQPVTVVRGDSCALKITTPFDLAVAELLITTHQAGKA